MPSDAPIARSTALADIQCLRCGARREQPIARSGRPRLPKGWKIFGDAPYCRACTTDAYVRRSIVLPIAGPLDGTWTELRTSLGAAWSDSTACANWMTTELDARDVRRRPEDARLAPMPRIYLYPEARRLFPAIPSRALPALERELQAQYRAHRHALLWTRSRTLATHRFPYPLPIPAQAWSVAEVSGAWHLSFRLGERRWTVRLRAGRDMRYHIMALRQIVSGDAVPGGLALYQVTTHRDDHRPQGTRPSTRVMVRIPAWFPRRAPRSRTGVLEVRSAADCFLVAEDGTGRSWVVHADHVRRWVMAYDRQRQRLIADRTALCGNQASASGMADRLATLARRHRHRLDTWTHDVSRHVVDYANRRRVQRIHSRAVQARLASGRASVMC